MKTFDLNGTRRTDVGKKSTHELRRQKLIPCVLYGQKKDENGNAEAIHFSVKQSDVRNLIYTPHIYVVNLTIDGETHKAVMREVQFHPVDELILHIDFYEVTESKPIMMRVPVKLNGLARGVRAGGKLSLQMRRIKVKSTYDKIPETLEIDVTNLGMGKSVKIGDLNFENLEFIDPVYAVVATVRQTRTATNTVETEETEAATEAPAEEEKAAE